MKISVGKVSAILLLCGIAGIAHAQESAASPRLLVHLLDYLAKDYAGAVSDGAIISEGEYREQVEFAHEAQAMGDALPDTRSDGNITSGLARLTMLIDEKAPPAEVSQLALQLKRTVTRVAHVAESPDRWPDLARGRTLYQANCASCHGADGAGDGPAGATLNPKPANFKSEAVGAELPPARAFNTIREGIPGTAMVAWPKLSDLDAWNLAFYVTSLHVPQTRSTYTGLPGDLVLAATQSDRELMTSIPGTEPEKRERITSLRLHSGEPVEPLKQGLPPPNTLTIARRYLAQAQSAYAAGNFRAAKQAALLAYLEGIEPVEPRLRAMDARFVGELESRMAAVRGAIEQKSSATDVESAIRLANQIVDAADQRLAERAAGPWVTFVLTAGILLREGFEAVLILIALLAVIRASGTPKAARWVHGGWVAALGVGFLSWFLSGWLLAISGAQREMLEGVTSLLAVSVLLYIGFWLHRRTEMSRWTHFIEVQVKTALQGRNLWGLSAIAFMAVFREAFETVLFMRAVTLEGGAVGTTAMAAGVAVSLTALVALSWLLLRSSARLPIRNIFALSSLLMAILAVVLTGKGFHALQETGALSVTGTWWHGTWDLLGIYATWETIIPQLLIAALVWGLWVLGKRPAAQSAKEGH